VQAGRRSLPPFCVIDRYVLREFFRYYFLALFGFVGFILIFDAFEKIDTFIDYQASVFQIFKYYAYATPYKLLLVAPVAPLLATFLALGSMTRFREMIVLKAAGISLYRIFMPLYVVGLLLGGLSFLASEFLMPESNRRARITMDQEIKKRTLKNLGSRINVTYLGEGNRLYLLRRYDIPRETMVDVTVQEFEADRLARRIDARKGIYQAGTWVLVEGVERTFTSAGRELAAPFDSLRLSVAELPTDFAKEEARPDEMSFPELRAYAERVRQSGSNAKRYTTDLHLRVAFQLSNLVVIMIASALAVQVRRGGIALGFGISLAVAFLYWCGLRAGQVLGHSGALPPPFAAWLGNIVFLIIAVVLLVRTPK
jgi:lipopolysaccharide export system permease protein